MFSVRSPIQTNKSLNPLDDERTFSTYQDTFSLGGGGAQQKQQQQLHGNLVNHYGNSAYLSRKSAVSYRDLHAKPFLSPSYHNLNSESFIWNKISNNYSNSFRTSKDNVLHRPVLRSATKTNLDYLYDVKIAPISKIDKGSAYEQEYLNERVNDHFVSNRWLKTDTINLRDTLACLMELSDYLRNKSFDTNSRNLFQTDSTSGFNELDSFALRFTRLNALMESIIISYDKLKQSGVELKKMSQNLVYADNLVNRNIWDRKLKPEFEREEFKNTENNLNKDKKTIETNKQISNSTLKEVQNSLNSIENFVLKNLNGLFEEARVILMKVLSPSDYEKNYLRDSNNYIRNDAKLPMKNENWYKLADSYANELEILINKTAETNYLVNELIKSLSVNLSNQLIKTHDETIEQVEKGLKSQGELITSQYDLKRELTDLNSCINDTKNKMKYCQMKNEFCLTQLEAPLAKIDPYYNENRRRQAEYANKVWSNTNDLRANLNEMNKYKSNLRDRIQRLDTNIMSNHTGLNYDTKTLVDPRRHATSTQPSIGFVNKSLTCFE